MAGDLSEEEKAAIVAFAAGDNSRRDDAIAAYRRIITVAGARGDAFRDFMAEVDNPSPDLALRSAYRRRLLDHAGGDYEHSAQNPRTP